MQQSHLLCSRKGYGVKEGISRVIPLYLLTCSRLNCEAVVVGFPCIYSHSYTSVSKQPLLFVVGLYFNSLFAKFVKEPMYIFCKYKVP